MRTMEWNLLVEGQQLLCLLVVIFPTLHQFLPSMTCPAPCCFVCEMYLPFFPGNRGIRTKRGKALPQASASVFTDFFFPVTLKCQ